MRLTCFVFGLALLAGAVAAQNQQGGKTWGHNLDGKQKQTVDSEQKGAKEFTNADVLGMVKAGLSDDQIILAIQRHVIAKFDLSSVALDHLKSEGVSTKVLDAMSPLTGQVFAIVNSGDMKPARLAEVYIFRVYSEKQSKDVVAKDIAAGTPRLDFSDVLNSASMFYVTARKKADVAPGPCQEVDEYYFARALTAKWASQNDPSQFGETLADEEGNFAFTEVPPGYWSVVVNGRVGMNRAVWEEKATIEDGKRVSIKLVTTTASCLDSQ